MKIAFVVDDFHGGAGNIVQLLALNFKQDYDISMVMTNLHSEPRYNLDGIHIYNQNSSVTGKNKLFGLFSSINNLGRLLKKEIKPDLIISFLDNNNTLVCLSHYFNKIPIIVAERSNPLAILPKAPWNFLRRIAYKRANVVTVQFKAFDVFDGSRFKNKTRVTSNIVEKSKYHKEHFNSENVKFVTMGRLAIIKRMDLMIDLFDQAQKKYPGIELHIFGDGPEKDKLSSMVLQRELGEKVFLHGYCNDVHKTLSKYDVYLMTSYQEGFPNSLCEAMAVGLPSVSIACHEGIVELTQNGKSGFSVLEGEENVFVNNMIKLAKDVSLRKELGNNATYISEKYSRDSIMQQWRDCISEAIKKS